MHDQEYNNIDYTKCHMSKRMIPRSFKGADTHFDQQGGEDMAKWMGHLGRSMSSGNGDAVTGDVVTWGEG